LFWADESDGNKKSVNNNLLECFTAIRLVL
jgi:hypothetical protein